MTVAELWDLCGDWMPLSKVHICIISTGRTVVYDFSEDVLRKYLDRTVVSYIYEAFTDTMCINIA